VAALFRQFSMRDLRGTLRKRVLRYLYTTTVVSVLPGQRASEDLVLPPKTGANSTAVERLHICDGNIPDLN
jgi:hypothetical protein